MAKAMSKSASPVRRPGLLWERTPRQTEELPVTPNPTLRPLERRVVRLVEQGVDTVDIGRRFRRSPEMIQRIGEWARLPRPDGGRIPRGDILSPLERRVLRWRAQGADYTEIGPRFRRSPGFVQQVERLARYKLGRG
jgi:DNA-binding CsgD family transcriptional regulator